MNYRGNLDIHYPAATTVAFLLVHSSAHQRIRSIFQAHLTTRLLDSSDPLNKAHHLASPKCKGHSSAARLQKIQRICTSHKFKALENIPHSIKLDVTLFFAQQSWISCSALAAIRKQSAQDRLDPAHVFGRWA